MKIGILTYHAVYNFGANLQALSTYEFLKEEGHDPIIIDFFPQELEITFDKTVPLEQANTHRLFLQKHFILTKRCINSKEVANEIDRNKIEGIIIGSDAVVQHYPLISRIRIIPSRKKILVCRIDAVKYETNFPNPFWGEFLVYLDKQVNVAMMSVSCQNTDYRLINRASKKRMIRLISKMKFISVRDNWTQKLFRHISLGEISPIITPDPVFAFNANVKKIPEKSEILARFKLPERYILLSFNSPKTVSNEWIRTFEKISKSKDFHCVALTMPGGIKFDNNIEYKVDLPLDPIDWYCIIKYSSGYVGEKMHPIIVSLHNCVPCFSFDHYGLLRFNLFLNENASKIYHILEKANLRENRVSILRSLFYKPPLPEQVLEKIIGFNKDKCIKFAENMLIEYNTMMAEILKKLLG